MTIYFVSSDYPKVINFCGIVLFFLPLGCLKKCNFAKLIFAIGQNLIGQKFMVVSLTQGGGGVKIKGSAI